MKLVQTLHSQEDESVNFVFDNGQEARYVQRDGYFIIYLSSQGGCDRACRFCHLTQTGQTDMTQATLDDQLTQAGVVLEHYARESEAGRVPKVSAVHYNWMARGEPLLNPVVRNEWGVLSQVLRVLANRQGLLDVRMNISTIMPEELGVGNDVEWWNKLLAPTDSYNIQPTIFYSLYSMQPKFRRRWLPKAMSAPAALSNLGILQRRHQVEIVIHHALIQGENDSAVDAEAIGHALDDQWIRARFNLVRYNPYSPAQGVEPDEETIQKYFDTITKYMSVGGSRIVPRVGFDVKASCGMFVQQ
ncbi:Dual-specificity RNA methyltransferase RlmN [compost metagenome]